MGIVMTIEETIESVKASFAMENFVMTEEDRERGVAILSGTKTIEEVIAELNKKYSHLRSN